MPTSDYTPTVDQIARKIMSRTRDAYGALVGTFNASTTPTGVQALAVAEDVITEVADVIGDDIPVALFDDASNVAAIRAAMQIELDFFSEQVNTGRSIYPQLEKQYQSAINSLAEAVLQAEAGDGKVENTAPSRRPSYSFPDSSTGTSLTGPM